MKKTVTLFLLAVLTLGSSQAQGPIRAPKALRAMLNVHVATLGHGVSGLIKQLDRTGGYGNYPTFDKYGKLHVDPIPNGSSEKYKTTVYLPRICTDVTSRAFPKKHNTIVYKPYIYNGLSEEVGEMFETSATLSKIIDQSLTKYTSSPLPSFSKNCEGFSLTFQREGFGRGNDCLYFQ